MYSRVSRRPVRLPDGLGVSVGAGGQLASALTNDFFVTLTDMTHVWEPAGFNACTLRDRTTGQVRYRATRADLVFRSHSILRSCAEVFAQDDSNATSVRHFVAA